ncbi:MAG: NAD-dependent epimerase/dehydratase family protein [candidate division KSB1 bacterium]|nr:NAD-dependent epimerase/dehydratase family protein [candidate division KSB1 bacterium]
MKALVTGANGFIGSHLVERLLAQGAEVRCLVRKTSNLRWLQGLDVQLTYGSLDSPASLQGALEGVDVVFHLAGATKSLTPEGYFVANTQGTARLLDACRERGNPRVVFVSSQAAAGPSDGQRAKTEHDPPTPITAYGKSKLQAELLVQEYAKTGPAVIVRPPVVYGPRDTDVLALFRLAARGLCPLVGSKRRLVSLIHVQDLVEGLLLAATTPQALGKTYFLCNDQPVDWELFAQQIASVLGKRCVRIRVPEVVLPVVGTVSELMARVGGKPALLSRDKVREMRQRYWVCDNTRAKQDLGFAPRVDVAEGVAQTAAWYRAQGWL